jgi:transposase-like protein
MSQHFLLSRPAKSLSLAQVFRMSDAEAEATFAKVRWAGTNGAPICPSCGGLNAYDCRRQKGAPRFRCRACKADFSITSGTLFASHKLPLRAYLAAIAIFCNEVKGKAALALSRDLGVQYKTAFVLAHKLREAMASELKGMTVGGPGRTVEIDGMYAGGYVKPANYKENRRDRRLAKNQNGKRQVVVVVREREGRTLPAVFKSESAALGWIASRVAKGTEIVADEAGSWNDLQGRFAMQRIDHQAAYSDRGVYSNGAESFFSRMRRAEIGHHHHVAGNYLIRYAQEASWR